MSVRVVALIGGECTGKSTLANALGDALPASVVQEVLRTFTAQHRRGPRAEEQVELVMQQQLAEADAMAETAFDWVVCDPATLMTAVYSRVYFHDDSLTDAAIVHAELTYDGLVWCDRDIPWVADPGQRDGEEWRDRAHTVIADLLPRITVPVHLASGDPSQRLASTRDFLARISRVDR